MTSSSSSSPEIQPAPTANAQERFTYKHATHEEVLEDLSSRFLLNLPDEELSSLERICFQVEQAHWFYEDFVREQNPKFPSLPLKKFSEMLFRACPLLHQWSHDHEQAFNTFMQYKTRVPVCGAIMLNETWEKCILVKGWKSSSGWGFPKGKINEDEPSHECAVREVLEETGYNLAGQINPADVIEMSIKEQLISLFIVPGVPEDFPFKTRTRKEISRIEWFKLTDLPTWKRHKAAPGKFYLISPFIAALKAFITAKKPRALESRSRKSIVLHGEDRSTQESSSSSADTAELQTPSPHYSEAIPANNGHIVTSRESDDEKALIAESMDPHFARLLSSLSLSAAKTADLKPPTVNSVAPPPHMSSSSKRSQTPDWSSRVPTYADTSLVQSPGLSKRLAVHGSHKGDKHNEFSGHALPIGSVETSRQDTSSSNPSSATFPAPPSLTMPSTRKQGMSSRRSSSIADISPYLSRPAEVPASGKRLKQLALLESVADESSKMTPTVVNRELPSIHGPDRRHPMGPASVPVLATYSTQGNLCPFDPSVPVPLPQPTRGTNTPLQADPFQVRPPSSQLSHSSPMYSVGMSGRGTVHQNGTLAILSGSPRVPPPVGAPRSPPVFMTAYPSTQPNIAPPIYPYPSASEHAAPSGLPLSYPVRDTYAVPAAQATSPLQSRPPLPSSSAQLLSILNGDRASAAPASVPRVWPPRAGLSLRTD